MTIITRNTKVTLEGAGTITLRPADYATKGGEGAIYRSGGNILKLYLDPNKFERDGMAEKIKLLSKNMRHDSIVAPKGLVLSTQNAPIGYYMPYVNGEAYPRLFTNEYRNQTKWDDASVVALTAKMHEVLQYTHSRQALMVDANELNWLADTTEAHDPKPYVIDVDSWAVGRFKASVIMPSIRDWHSQQFNENTDWFAWGVVSFLLFTGTHPYKGKLDGYKSSELERRMKDNASVFLPKVHLNHAVREFSCIPGPLRDWYNETFTHGYRGEAPSPLETGKGKLFLRQVMKTVTTLSGGLIYEELFSLPHDTIVSIWPCGVIRTASGDLYETMHKSKIGHSDACRIAIVTCSNGWLIAELHGTQWSFRIITHRGLSQVLSHTIKVDSVIRSGNRLFIANETEFAELGVHAFLKPILTIQGRWKSMGIATRWYNGVGVADILGTAYLIAPYSVDSVAYIKVPELDTLTVVGGVAGNRFIEVMTIDSQGAYRSYAFAFDAGWKEYTVEARDCDGPEQNITILDKGVTASIVEDGEMVITVPWKGEKKIVADKDLTTKMKLSHIGDRVVYLKGGALWSLRMQ